MTRTLSVLVVLAAGALVGCQSNPIGALVWNPFSEKDRTTYRTPRVRADEALALAEGATGEDTPDQQEAVVELARRIQSEPDPLVRQAIVKSVGRFGTPLASQVLEAGLSDPHPIVRIQCCHELGNRADPVAVAPLSRAIRSDSDMDVRIAATRALGHIKTPETTAALVAALEHRNPAMQLAGVEAMKEATGQDFGGVVESYIAYAKGETPPPAPTEGPSIATRLRRLSPF